MQNIELDSEAFSKVCKANGTILIQGPTGSGKTHLAREIHRLSPRRDRPFMVVNLATMSPNLIESELFGHERGAFSGAHTRRMGKLEAANGGTVLLDEIGELPLQLQVRLLEVLNNACITPLGSNREVNLNVRFICATNRNLSEMVRDGQFREDLYFRIHLFSLELPCLNGRPDKIEQQIQNWLKEQRRIHQRDLKIDPECLEHLLRREWPGNIRELRNTLEYGAAMSEENKICFKSLPQGIPEKVENGTSNQLSFPVNYHEAKAEFEKRYLLSVLRTFRGKVNATARGTQISKVTLIEKIRTYGINLAEIKVQAYERSRESSALNYL